MGREAALLIVAGDRVMYRGQFRKVYTVHHHAEWGPCFFLSDGMVTWDQCGRYPDGRDQPALFEGVEKQPGLF